MHFFFLLFFLFSSAFAVKYIVLLWEGTSDASHTFSLLFSEFSGAFPPSHCKLLKYADIGDLHVAIVDIALSTEATLLAGSPKVKLVELVVPVYANSAAYLVQRPATWNLARICRRTYTSDNIRYFYNAQACQGVDAYVLDTGVDESHPEFQGRVQKGPNFSKEAQNTDLNGHGTHVAGIIGSKSFGVCKNIQIIPLKVMNAIGVGDSASVILALGWIQANRKKNRPSVVNISFSGPFSQAMNIAVNQLSQLGVVVVAAAGNSGSDACSFSPASAASALTVGATTSQDEALAFPPTNFGACVNLSAPGGIIRSTYLGHQAAYMSGTSMAAPHVTGAVAMYWSLNPGLSAADVVKRVMFMATRGVLQQFTRGVNVFVYVEP
jgi:subtilisin family serine protease